MHTNTQSSSRNAGPSSITLPPPPVFASFTLQGYTPDASAADHQPPATVLDASPTLVFKTAPSSPFSEPPSPASPPVQWFTPPTTPHNDLGDPQAAQQHASGQVTEYVPLSGPLLVPHTPHRVAGEHANPTERIEGSDDAFPSMIDVALDSGFDEEGLSTLEKIYLYARSDSNVHRTFIAHALPSYLEQVTPQEAVEYVLPLIHNLAMDEEESVKAALATELVPVIWWFFSHCQLIPDDVEGREPYASTSTMVTLSVQAFTPILATLLLGTSERIIAPARFAIVDLLSRMQSADKRESYRNRGRSPSPERTNEYAYLHNGLQEGEDQENPPAVGLFKGKERGLFRQELLEAVIIGMGRLDLDVEYETPEGYSASTSSRTPMDEPRSQRPSPTGPDNPYFPPVSQSASPQSTSPASLSPANTPSTRNELRKSPLHSPLSPSHLPSSPHSPSSSSTRKSPPPSPGREWPEEIQRAPNRMEQDPSHHQAYEEAYEYTGSDARKAALGRLSSMSLMAAVTATGRLEPNIQKAFVKEIERVGRDNAYFYVRREASLALGALAKVVPEELVTVSLLPLFDTLRWDPDYRVRQSALFALPAILARLSPNQRRTVALETAMALSKDRYGIVRVGVIETLGEVLHTFQNDPGGPPRELLELFLGRPVDRNVREGSHWSCYNDLEPQPTDQALELFFTDPERPLICAFNFPAVVVTLGQRRWPELREFYFDLGRNKNVHIRKTMAASLGEIAMVIGPGAAVQDLLPVWWESVRLDEESVRTKAVEALGKLLVAIPREVAKGLVDGLVTLWEEGQFKGWRERDTVVNFLEFFLEKLGSVGVGGAVRRLILKGLEDNVAAVREAVRSVMPKMWSKISSDPALTAGLREDLESLANSSMFRRRMTFIACMQVRIEHITEDRLANEIDAILRSVSRLARDPVVDVRIAVSRFLSVLYATYGHRAANSADFQRSVEVLSSDPSHDVRSFLFLIQQTPPSDSMVMDVDSDASGRFNATTSPPALISPHHAKSFLFSRPPTTPLASPTAELANLDIMAQD